jgi:hypothetical protein
MPYRTAEEASTAIVKRLLCMKTDHGTVTSGILKPLNADELRNTGRLHFQVACANSGTCRPVLLPRFERPQTGPHRRNQPPPYPVLHGRIKSMQQTRRPKPPSPSANAVLFDQARALAAVQQVKPSAVALGLRRCNQHTNVFAIAATVSIFGIALTSTATDRSLSNRSRLGRNRTDHFTGLKCDYLGSEAKGSR